MTHFVPYIARRIHLLLHIWRTNVIMHTLWQVVAPLHNVDRSIMKRGLSPIKVEYEVETSSARGGSGVKG